jgi:hypothetical protein
VKESREKQIATIISMSLCPSRKEDEGGKEGRKMTNAPKFFVKYCPASRLTSFLYTWIVQNSTKNISLATIVNG